MGQKVKVYLEQDVMSVKQYHNEWSFYADGESPEFISEGAAEFIAEAKDLIIRER